MAQCIVPASVNRSDRLAMPPQRGLALIKSCAKIYANGVDIQKPSTDSALHQRAERSARGAKTSIGRMFVPCLFFLVLPSLALAGIVWWGTMPRPATGLQAEIRVDAGPSQAARPSPPTTAHPSDEAAEGAKLTNANPDAPGDIIVRKVKTQLVTPSRWVPSKHESDDAIQASTELGPSQ